MYPSIGIMEKRMETTIMGFIGYNIGVSIGITEKRKNTIVFDALTFWAINFCNLPVLHQTVFLMHHE